MADICSITAAQQAASDAAAKNALDNSKAAGTQSKLEAMAAHTQSVMMVGGKVVSAAPPPNITKKHDLINFFLGQGLKGETVVSAMAGKGFKIKVADVNANIKWYGTEKIPANFPKAGAMPAIEGHKIVDILPPKPTFTPPPIKPPAPSPTIQSLTEQTPEEKFIMHKQVGPQAGSNPGGMYEDMDGKKWYVKLYAEEGQGIGEHVSNAIYRRLGVGAPESKLFKQANGKTAFASKVLENEGTIEKVGLTKERADKILDGFAADVLTANWDAVGLSLDNVVVLNKLDNILVRIDQGGSLLYRAKGALKPNESLGVLSEWTSFAPGGKNPAYAKVFNAAGIQKAEDLGEKLIKQIEDIKTFRANLGPGGYRAFIESLGVSPTHSLKLANMLESRTNGLIAKAEQIKQAAKEAEEMKKVIEGLSDKGIVYQPYTSSYQLKTLPDSVMVVTDNKYTGIQHLVSKPPKEIIASGQEAISKWYGKHVPNMSVNQTYDAIKKLNPNTNIDFYKVEGWMYQGASGIEKMPVMSPPKPGFVADANATTRLDKLHDKTGLRFSQNSINALRSYGGSGYGAMNDALRKSMLDQSSASLKIRAIDYVMKDTVIGTDTVLYRGLGHAHPFNTMSFTELQRAIGSEFTELGYGSHSTILEKASGFSAKNRFFRVHAPKNTHGVWMRKSGGAGVPTEQEFLMHRSTRVRILGVSEGPMTYQGQSLIIDVEILAQEVISDAHTAAALTRIANPSASVVPGSVPTAKPAVPTIGEPPYYINTKHEMINFYLGKGLDSQDVVNAVNAKGYKIKVADVNANKKYYGTSKIPGKYAKASEVLKGDTMSAQLTDEMMEEAVNAHYHAQGMEMTTLKAYQQSKAVDPTLTYTNFLKMSYEYLKKAGEIL